MKVFSNLVVPLSNCRGLCANLYNNAGEAQYKKSTNKKPNNPDGIHAGSPINSISAKSYCCLEERVSICHEYPKILTRYSHFRAEDLLERVG